MKPRVLVLLAAYNGMRWIASQVDSILNQRGVQVTILLSVDKSSDGTERWATELALNNPRVICLDHGFVFGGASANFFRLIKEADLNGYDYYSFSDQDDLWNPDKLVTAIAEIQLNAADAYSSNVTAFWDSGCTKEIIKSQPQVEFDYLFEAAGPGCTYVFTNKFFKFIHLHVLNHSIELQTITLHDWYCYALCRANGYTWFIHNISSMLYRQHESNQVGVNSGFDAFKNRTVIFLDGWLLNQSVAISDIVGMSSSAFVRSWAPLQRADLIRLAFSGWKCRRRLRDKVVFSLFCIMLSLYGLR
ncbi:glycosyltransferase [Pseudomonas sp. EL_65y_Pfl2_R95]|uniref:glycosyltransferase n=1 Tax=Pseudomonas sp. EL_65y_Pfl2_R95 TaxID=3088698 RepID=UPI0030DD4C7D